ncbi:4-alpha-glucanotransferase [compost metagenome]
MVVQMEDVFGQIEQVNLPATEGQYPNWRRRLSPDLEEWTGDALMQALAVLLRGLRTAGQIRRPRAGC